MKISIGRIVNILVSKILCTDSVFGIKKYRELDYKYTNEEYTQLLGRLPNSCVIRAIIVAVVLSDRRNGTIKTFLLNMRRDDRYRYASLYLYSTEDIAYKVMYESPLQKIPLFLNHERQDIKAIAQWRLDIGK